LDFRGENKIIIIIIIIIIMYLPGKSMTKYSELVSSHLPPI